MTLKQRALLQTVGILIAIVSTSIGVTLVLENLTQGQILFGLSVASIALLIYSMYGVILGRLEYHATLEKLSKNNPTIR
jgi:hypothetical protein